VGEPSFCDGGGKEVSAPSDSDCGAPVDWSCATSSIESKAASSEEALIRSEAGASVLSSRVLSGKAAISRRLAGSSAIEHSAFRGAVTFSDSGCALYLVEPRPFDMALAHRRFLNLIADQLTSAIRGYASPVRRNFSKGSRSDGKRPAPARPAPIELHFDVTAQQHCQPCKSASTLSLFIM
jgi:hypothetical protein